MSVQQGAGNLVATIKKIDICIKCTSIKISGPKYIPHGVGISLFDSDKLRYTCETCGFHWLVKCADAE